MSRSLHTGFFEDQHDLLRAAEECRARAIPVVDVVSPFPIHGLDAVLGIRPSRLPWVTLIGGAVGLTCGFWLEYWTSAVNWPINVGGKPFDSFPAFVPVAFELTILFAGLSTALALLVRSRLWPSKSVPAGLECTTDDRHALILAQADAAFRDADFPELLRRHGAVEYRRDTEVQS
jgi:hypothetical protein